MKFMLIRRADANTENGAMPSQEMFAAMAARPAQMAMDLGSLSLF